MQPVRYPVAPFGWLAVLGLAFLASSALMRRERPALAETTAPLTDADDLLVRIYA